MVYLAYYKLYTGNLKTSSVNFRACWQNSPPAFHLLSIFDAKKNYAKLVATIGGQLFCMFFYCN